MQYKKACGFERAGVYVGYIGLGYLNSSKLGRVSCCLRVHRLFVAAIRQARGGSEPLPGCRCAAG